MEDAYKFAFPLYFALSAVSFLNKIGCQSPKRNLKKYTTTNIVVLATLYARRTCLLYSDARFANKYYDEHILQKKYLAETAFPA